MAAKTKTHGEMIAEEMNRDPDFRAEWERTELARVVAAQVIEYRHDHGLSQRDLAAVLGWKQPQVVRVESGETNPTIDTMIVLSRRLGMEFAISIAPEQQTKKFLTKRAVEKAAVQHRDGVAVIYAAASS